MINLDMRISFIKVLNVILTIILISILGFAWWYFRYQNPADIIANNFSRLANPKFLYSIYGSPELKFNRPAFTIVEKNKIYVADTNNGRIVVFNYRGSFSTEFGRNGMGKLKYPVSISFFQNEIYVADFGTKKVHVFDLSGRFLRYFAVKSVKDPISIFSKDKKVYILDANQNKVKIFDQSGKELTSFGSTGSKDGQFYFPYSVYVTKDDKIYISDSNNNRIQIFDASGKLLRIFNGADILSEGNYSVPRGTAFDGKGNLYTAEGLINYVSVTDVTGKVFLRFNNAEPTKSKTGFDDIMRLPTSVYIDESQRLYVTEYGGSRILVYSLR